jgi:branched-chain amino acid transport system ATP-binding protein
VHAVIGTNGAGKSTLINMLSGEMPPRAAASSCWAGRHRLAAAAPRARRPGPQLPAQHHLPEFTVFENCRLARRPRTQRPWRWWQSAPRCKTSTTRARGAARAGLADC